MTPRPDGRTTKRLRALVIEAYGTACHLCGRPIPLDVATHHPLALQLDHLIPHADGGPSTVENLRPAHARCNARRGLGALPTTVAGLNASDAGPPASAAGFFKPPVTPDKTSGHSLSPAPEKTRPPDDEPDPTPTDDVVDLSEWIV